MFYIRRFRLIQSPKWLSRNIIIVKMVVNLKFFIKNDGCTISIKIHIKIFNRNIFGQYWTIEYVRFYINDYYYKFYFNKNTLNGFFLRKIIKSKCNQIFTLIYEIASINKHTKWKHLTWSPLIKTVRHTYI